MTRNQCCGRIYGSVSHGVSANIALLVAWIGSFGHPLSPVVGRSPLVRPFEAMTARLPCRRPLTCHNFRPEPNAGSRYLFRG